VQRIGKQYLDAGPDLGAAQLAARRNNERHENRSRSHIGGS
jgi:hypothetical protein